MKILIVNSSDIQGGAAKAAYRLHRALIEEGIDSQMLVQNKHSDDYTVIGPKTKIQKAIAKIRSILDQIPVKFYKNRTKTPFSPAWLPFSNIVKKINEINPDIVHLHWIANGMIKIEDLANIKTPIVWSLHDNWAFTGGCHYDEECGAYKNSCGSCKVLGSQKQNDLSRKVFKRKEKTFSKIDNITIVALSRWIENCAKESYLLKDKKVVNLPNPIDTTKFKAIDKNIARDILNLPKDKKLILYGAMGGTSNPRKGFKELREAIEKLKSDNIEFIVFGSSEPKDAPKLRYKTHYLGRLQDDTSLQVLYSAADVTVVPSLQENLSNTILESLSCDTSIVAFGVGGNSDMIAHKQTGYLANPFDAADLANGIEWVINSANYDELSKNARKKALREFDSKIIAQKYISLYEEILNKKVE